MIQVQDIILSLRSRLRDKAIEKEYSDNELLDFINMAYASLSTRLKTFISFLEFDLSTQSPVLPKNSFCLVNVNYNGKDIDILPTIYLQKNKSNIVNLSCTLVNDTIELYPDKKDGILKVDFNIIKSVARIEDYLYFNVFYKEAIIYYCMYLALQKEPRIDSISKSQYYQNLYELEVNRIFILNSEINSTHDLFTQYQRV